MNIMYKMFKKTVLPTVIALFLIFSFALTSGAVIPGVNESPAPVPVSEDIGSAESTPQDEVNLDELMKAALTAAKTYIKIDDKKFPTFNYYYNPGDMYNNNIETWYFSWYSNDGMSNININVSGNGKILYYGKYEYNEKLSNKNVRLAKISKSKAKDYSDAFLKKILGDEFKNFKLQRQYLGYPSERYNLFYTLNKNGYDYPDYSIYIEVDKMTGEVMCYTRYYYNVFYESGKDFNFQDASKVITREEALKSYLDKIGLDLVYTSQFDWQTKELKIQPVYRLKNNYNEYISAVNGELVTITNDLGIVTAKNQNLVMEEAPLAASADTAAGISFSKAELSALEKLKDYITADKAIEIMAKAFDLDLGDLSKFSINTNLNKDYINQKQYCWNIYLSKNSDNQYENYNATVDARNGNILSYSSYSYIPYYDYDYNYDYDGSGRIKGSVEPKYIYTYDEAKKIVMDKITKLSPYDIDKNFELVETRTGAQAKQSAKVNSANGIDGLENSKDKSAYYYFNFIRKVNGIRFESNGIYVNFDNTTGAINTYRLSWYEDAKFPKIDKIVSSEKALNSIANYSDYKIYYMSDGRTADDKINAVLVYKFDDYVTVDPFTGKYIGWDFKEIKKPDPDPNYKDLDGHWSEKIVKILTDNGIYVWGGEKFDPDKDITKGELLDYLNFYTYNYYYFSEVQSGIFVNSSAYFRDTNYSQEKDLDKILTKQEAAKIICEIAGYGELGKHSEIFIYPFAGGKCDSQYKGYIAILKAFGLISGDENGNFNATETLTRAGAAEIVYNIIMAYNK